MVVEENVSFNAKEINAIYKLKDNSNAEGNNIIESTLPELMEDAVRALAKPGAKWDVSPTGIKTLPVNSLRPEANLWVLVKKRLIPTTYDKTMSSRVMTAYCIMCRIPLDVGRIIVAQIRWVFNKSRGQLFFPSLIMNLYANTSIGGQTEVLDAEKIIEVSRVIAHKTLRQLMRGSQHLPESAKATKRPHQPTPSPKVSPPKPQTQKKGKSSKLKCKTVASPDVTIRPSPSSSPSPPLPLTAKEPTPPPPHLETQPQPSTFP